MELDICSMNMLRTLLNAKWCIEPTLLENLLPSVKMLINGHSVKMEGFSSSDKPVIENAIGSGNQNADYVCVLPIKGVMTKYSNCGEMCMLDMNQIIEHAKVDPNCVALVLDMDSGGGEAGYLSFLANTLQNFGKPIVGYINGYCCSACYYLGSQSTELYASDPMDTIGSIGTVLGVQINNEENSSYREIRVYATKSTRKHSYLKDIMDGKTDEVASNELDPLNELFIHNVQKGRKGKISDVAFDGETYNAEDAQKLGMIDGQMRTIKEAIARAFQLANESKVNNNNQNQNAMNFEKISKIVGREVTAETPLNAEELQMVENHYAILEANNPTPPTVNEPEPSIEGTIADAVVKALEPTVSQISALQQRIEKLEGPGASIAEIPPVDGNKQGATKHAWEDPNDPINQSMKRELGQ